MLAPKSPDNALSGKTVILRISVEGAISHTAVPLIDRLSDMGARIVVVAGLGDPAGDINPALSLLPFAATLEQMTGRPVKFVSESLGTGAEAGLARVGPGEIALMENLRFHSDARRRQKVFAMRLSVLGDFFIDAGDPPAREDGWQVELKKILPEPELPAFADILKEDA